MQILNKKWFIYSFLLFGFLPLQAQDFKLDAGKIVQKEFVEELDFELELGKIILPVKIADQTFRFLLDTGAPNIISKNVANMIQPEAKKVINVSDANNKNQSMEIVPLPEIVLGSLRFVNGATIVVDLENHPVLKCYKLDGFIGSNFFKNAVLQVDYPSKKIRISNTIKSFSPKVKGYAMQLIGPQLGPYISIEHQSEGCDEGSEYALLDTGMDGFYDLSNRVYDDFKKGNVIKTLSETTGIVAVGLLEKSEPTPHRLVQVQKLKLNGKIFTNVVTETTDDDNSRIGLDAFKYGKVTLDFNKKKWYYDVPEQHAFSEDAPRLTPTIINQKLVVGIVWDEALRGKIQFGNPILRIDHYDLEKLSLCEIVALKEYLNMRSSHEIAIKNDAGETVILNTNKK
jgi:predicted aspartyl protease